MLRNLGFITKYLDLEGDIDFTPLAGTEETCIGDLILNKKNKFVIIEFKRDFHEVMSEIQKFNKAADKELKVFGAAKRALKPHSKHHHIIYGFISNDNPKRLRLKRVPYFECDSNGEGTKIKDREESKSDERTEKTDSNFTDWIDAEGFLSYVGALSRFKGLGGSKVDESSLFNTDRAIVLIHNEEDKSFKSLNLTELIKAISPQIKAKNAEANICEFIEKRKKDSKKDSEYKI